MRISFLLLAVLGSITGNAEGQGTVTFVAGAGQIAAAFPSLPPWPLGDPSTNSWLGRLNIALYGARVGTELKFWGSLPDLFSPSSGWKMMTSPVISKIAPVPGAVPAVICTMDASLGYPGEDIQCIIVAWTGDYPSLWSAVNGYSWIAFTGQCGSGGLAGWRQKTGAPLIPAVVKPGAFQGLILGPLDWQADFPMGQTAEAGNSFVHLTWSAGWPTWSFGIARAVVGGPYELLASTTGTSYTDTTVLNETTYYYSVRLCQPHSSVLRVTPHGPPRLGASVAPGAQGLTLTWPDWATRFRAYSATNLENPTWTAVTNAVYTNNGSFHLSVTPSNVPGEFFRLSSP